MLFGGRYDKLLNKMGRGLGGIGFAVYMDLLEGLSTEARGYDVDVLILYKEGICIEKLSETVGTYVQKGLSVTAQKSIPSKMRYKELVDLTGEENQ